MTEQFLRIGGTDGQSARPLKTDSSGVLETKVTGSNIEEVRLFDNLAITDSIQHPSSRFHQIELLNNKKEFDFIAYAQPAFDVDISIGLQIFGSASRVWNGTKWENISESGEGRIIIPAGSSARYLINSKWPFINDMLPGNYRFIARNLSGKTATTGRLYLVAIGG
jgi:hypothetical protein